MVIFSVDDIFKCNFTNIQNQIQPCVAPIRYGCPVYILTILRDNNVEF